MAATILFQDIGYHHALGYWFGYINWTDGDQTHEMMCHHEEYDVAHISEELNRNLVHYGIRFTAPEASV